MPRVPRATVRLVAAVLCALSVATPSAHAVTVSVPTRCAAAWTGQGSQPIPVTVAGLVPAAAVRLTLEVDGKAVGGIPTITADAGGAFATQLAAWTTGLPIGPSHATPARIVVAEASTGVELGAARLSVTNVGFAFDGRPGSGDTGRIWEISGLRRFGGGRTYWAHYFRGGKEIARQRLGRAGGACGYLRTRKRLVPPGRYGRFDVRVQASRQYRSALPWLGGTVTARRVPRMR